MRELFEEYFGMVVEMLVFLGFLRIMETLLVLFSF